MKASILFPALVLALGLTTTSCSKCYECTHPVTVNGQTTQSTPEEVCTADDSEISDREANGETCVDKS